MLQCTINSAKVHFKDVRMRDPDHIENRYLMIELNAYFLRYRSLVVLPFPINQLDMPLNQIAVGGEEANRSHRSFNCSFNN